MAKDEILKISSLVGALGKFAPFDYAEEWDNVGFLAGNADNEVKGIVVSVNLGRESLDEAKVKGANVIVCHHPPIFKPLTKLTKASHPFLFEALDNHIAVISLHTNFDLASYDLSQEMVQKLGVKYKEPLTKRGSEDTPTSIQQGKFVTYAPEASVAAVREAVANAGAGVIGNYTQCSFYSEGTGTFLGGEGSNPVIGRPGTLEITKEVRMEMIFPWKNLDRVVAAARAAHPYEEMAFDVIKLSNTTKNIGYGFVADYDQKINFDQFVETIKKLFQLDSITVVKPAGFSGTVKRIAFSPGSGSSFIHSASAKGVDAYVCGEVGYHHMLDAKRNGVALLVLGHSNSERFYVETVAKWCSEISKGRTSTHKVFEIVDVRG